MRKTCVKTVSINRLSCVQKTLFINTLFFSIDKLSINLLFMLILFVINTLIFHSLALLHVSVNQLFYLFSTHLTSIITILNIYILVIDNSLRNFRNTINPYLTSSFSYLNYQTGGQRI